MEEAQKVHSKSNAEFRRNVLSEVYFLNSFIRFLSDKKDLNEKERIEHLTETALRVCRENLLDHPQTAATLLFAGILAKRRKERDQAEQKLTKSFELFQECLGEHFMTAESLKTFADLFFYVGKTEEDLDICFAYYEGAMKMLDDLGMGESKRSVLILKNLGVCHRKRNNFAKAKELLTKAGQVSELELEGDHTWKVWIKTELAILHDKEGDRDEAKALMLEGLLMGKRLNLPLKKMGSKDDVQEFIKRYPETFPERISCK